MLYIVKTPILMNRKYYAPGDEIDLDDASAKDLSHAIDGPVAPAVFSEIVVEADPDAIFDPLPEVTEESATQIQECKPRKPRKAKRSAE
jgi:hypothetical protein